MKNIYLVILLSLSLHLHAQTWAPVGATWHYSFMQMFSYGYLKIESVKDTVILGKDCSKMQKTQYGYSYPGVYDTISLDNEYSYIDSNNVVYRFRNNQFDTLYNFNALVGDKWMLRGGPVSNDSGQVIVDSLGFEVINADTLKAIYVSYVPGSCIGWYAAEIVERIGCLNNYMFPNYVNCIMDADEGGPFRCYSDNDFPLYDIGITSSCDYITNIDEHAALNDRIRIYPTPASSDLIIENKNALLSGVNFTLLTAQWQKLLESYTSHQVYFHIDISRIASGIYFLQISDSNGSSLTKKVIKQ